MLGSTIGPYRVRCKLGEGGMGTVYEAVHQVIERRVALKVLHAQYAANKELTRRLFNEARAVNRVDHPGLVQISDFGHLPDNTAYIVMELLKGETLGARLRRLDGPMPLAEVLCIGRQVADALAAAHARSIVHRDLKPDNVMLVPDPYLQFRERTKLLDFGIAKLDTSKDSARLKTVTHTLLGTPAYMSPEQCRGAGLVDDKTDVYAFGILLYTMLTGKPPFAGAGLGEIIGKHLYEEPPSLASRAPGVPEHVTALVHSLLRKDKEQRPAMSQVAGELEALLAHPSRLDRRAAAAADDAARAGSPGERYPAGEASTLPAAVGVGRDPVNPWRHLLLKAAVLCGLGMVGGFGLPWALESLVASRPPLAAVSAVASADLGAQNLATPSGGETRERPAERAQGPSVRKEAHQPAWTSRGDALRSARKKPLSERPATTVPAKHAPRPAHGQPEKAE